MYEVIKVGQRDRVVELLYELVADVVCDHVKQAGLNGDQAHFVGSADCLVIHFIHRLAV